VHDQPAEQEGVIARQVAVGAHPALGVVRVVRVPAVAGQRRRFAPQDETAGGHARPDGAQVSVGLASGGVRGQQRQLVLIGQDIEAVAVAIRPGRQPRPQPGRIRAVGIGQAQPGL